MNIQNFESTVYGEGGNLMSDGFGKVFFSDVFEDANLFQRGWDSTQTVDSLFNLFGNSQHVNLKGCSVMVVRVILIFT
jgi:hypothetical protein